MKLRGSLACLLLALCLGRGEASPLLNAGASAQGVGEAIGHGVGDAISHGIGEAFGQGAGEAAPSGIRGAVGPAVGDAFGHRVGEAIHQGVGEAAHALGNTGSEAGRQAENIIRHGLDGVHSSWQGMPGSNGASGTNGQLPSGGHGTFGSQGGLGAHSQGNPGGSGTPWGPGHPGGSDGSFGTNSLGRSWGQGGNGGSQNMGTNAQGTVAQPGYGSVRGNSNTECTNSPPSGSGGSSSSSGNYNAGSSSGSSGGSGGGNKPGCDNSGNEVRVSGGSGGQIRGGQRDPSSFGDVREISKESSRLVGGSQGNYQGQGSNAGGEAVGGISNLNSQTSSGIFDFDTFWKNLKSKLGFINWDAINKGQVPPPSTRALLYFSRLWEDFKHNTPFLNWKAIIEGANASSLQKRAGGAGQNNYNQQAYPTASGGQYPAKIPAKGGVTLSSSASRAQPGLLQWVKFW
ncbi:dermokine [Pteropus vampyrus]|uniref:Dermokine n=1 Tax=Pteropus vampyrus TaxID=132908 RepID=A0A6P6BYM3_PTEVA|nr:dermokine [Pteropus vampyrus]